LAAHLGIVLEDSASRVVSAHVQATEIDAAGPVRVTLTSRGEMGAGGRRPLCRFAARITAFAGTALVRLDLTIHNPRRARHRGGRWDLGDPGSVVIRSLNVVVRSSNTIDDWRWRLLPSEPEEHSASGRIAIFQVSSGGAMWASPAHRDRDGRVALPFRGCQVTDGARAIRLDRASPILSGIAGDLRICAVRPRFWQEFPSRLDGGPDGLRIGLFPSQAGPFELQGGEQKTFTVFLQVAPTSDADLGWAHSPIVPSLPPAYVADCAVVPHLIPAADDPHADYVQLVGEALDGPHSFFAKREAVDEYGWRHFGDTWADHELSYFTGPRPLISHYNNQYDLVYGFLLHFARSGDPRWFELGTDLARHVIDIDLYRTEDDKPAYSGGQFWHTAHYDDAGRATHRTYTADSPLARNRNYGGGPSCEQLYTTGLLYFHYLTGDPAARAAVVQLGDWVVRLDDGRDSLLGYLDAGPTGLASATRSFDYHGPGRGPGNAIATLLNAYRLTGRSSYIEKAEELIARCVHPSDDPERHDLLDAERRWSYLAFLQTLGTYLDFKRELGQRDRAFAYARASLIRYATWMLAHETPFAERFDRLEYATESWPAQDIRKSNVFDYAAQYGPPALRAAMSAKAAYFFAQSVGGVASFATRACTRPLAVLLAAGIQRASFRVRPPQTVAADESAVDFGQPSRFRSQRDRVRARLATPSGWLALARAGLRPSLWRRLLTGKIW
jgi:hypothetical protein